MIWILAALALGLTVLGGAWAEEMADADGGHTEEHTVWEQMRDDPEIIATDSGETHLVRWVYDLYCEDCQRILTEGCRTEETEEPHDWAEERIEPACEAAGMIRRTCRGCGMEITETLPPLEHEYAEVSLLIKREPGDIPLSEEESETLIGTVLTASTCTEPGLGRLLCLRCQGAEQEMEIPAGGHRWGDWQEEEIPGDMQCVTDQIRRRVCLDCGETEEETVPAPGHQWQVIRYSEPTCTENGVAVRQCGVCHQEERIETPALGHVYTWVEVTPPSVQGDGLSEYRCLICGDVAQRQTIRYTEILYNNTITSFGPTTRELIGGSVWNRVTPIDLSVDGVFTYPLVASNRYTVGTATVIIDHGIQTVSYHLSSPEVQIHSESLVIYPDLKALRTGENAVSLAFDVPIVGVDYFGSDSRVILGITLKADYNILAEGVQYFFPDEAQIEAMTDLID